MAGRINIRDLTPNQAVESTYLVRSKAMPVARNGKPYLNLTLSDATGVVEARLWDRAEQFDALFGEQDVVEVRGAAFSYQGRLQIKIEQVRRIPTGQYAVSDFLPQSKHDPETMFAELRQLLSQIEDPWIKQLVDAFLDDADFARRFKLAPAAKSIHHAHLNGLLEHTLAVMRLANQVAALYPRASRDYLLAGALLHDAGKTLELGYERDFEYSDEGRLIGHLVIASEMISTRTARIADFPKETELLLKHLALSHHGSYEFGSPRRPKILEALILNYLDELDSKVNAWLTAIDTDAHPRWTAYQKIFDRYLFKGILGGVAGAAPGNEQEGSASESARDQPLTYRPFADLSRPETDLFSNPRKKQ